MVDFKLAGPCLILDCKSWDCWHDQLLTIAAFCHFPFEIFGKEKLLRCVKCGAVYIFFFKKINHAAVIKTQGRKKPKFETFVFDLSHSNLQ